MEANFVPVPLKFCLNKPLPLKNSPITHTRQPHIGQRNSYAPLRRKMEDKYDPFTSERYICSCGQNKDVSSAKGFSAIKIIFGSADVVVVNRPIP